MIAIHVEPYPDIDPTVTDTGQIDQFISICELCSHNGGDCSPCKNFSGFEFDKNSITVIVNTDIE